MKKKIIKYSTSFLFTLLILLGVFISIEKYYYSSFQFIYWIFSAILITLFFYTKIHLTTIRRSQYIAFLIVSVLYFASWFLIPHFLRFGVYLFSIACFLYTSIVLFNFKSKILNVLAISAFVFSSFNLIPVLFYFAEKSIITRALMGTLFISNSLETKEYLFGKITYLHFVVIIIFFLSAFALFIKFEKQKTLIKPAATICLFILSFIMASFSGPFGAICSEYIIYQRDKVILKNMLDLRERTISNSNFHILEKKNEAKKILIIIGESLNPNYMSLYGYNQNTTPNLLKLSADTSKGVLFHFNNVISPEVTTVPSLKKALTNINNTNGISFENCITIVDLFDRAGYETFWISNQAPLGKFDTPTAAISSTADNIFFTASRNDIKKQNAASGNYHDGDLLDVFSAFAKEKKSNNKQVYFIHLQGSHFYYKDRYPKEFDVFKSSQSENQKNYLNTVIYNDFVVNKFIDLANKNNFDVTCYFSDHGENLEVQHNQEKYTRDMSQIPFLLYFSTEYLSKRKDLAAKLLQKKDTPGMTDNFFHDIQIITGIKSSLFDSKQSFISDDYIINKRRVVENKIPYD